MALVAGVLATAGGLAVIPSILKAVTDSMLFHPTRGQSHTPADADTAFEDLRIEGEDGVRVQAWWIPADRTGPGLTVLHFHGNAGSIADRLPVYLDLQRAGVHVLAAEYRGYGDSEGSPSEVGLLGDGRAAYREALRRARTTGDRLVIAGRSLGGAVAIRTAADADPGTLAGVWVESTFTDLATMAGRTLPLGARLVAYSFDSIGVVDRIDAPMLVLHGDRDTLIPHSHGRALADRALDARFVLLSGADHNVTPPPAARVQAEALRNFLEEVSR